MLWTLSRSVTEVDGSTTNGGVGLLKANGEQGDWPLPSNLQRPLELEASRAIISGDDDVLVVVGFEYPSTSSGLGPLATIHYGSPTASVPSSNARTLETITAHNGTTRLGQIQRSSVMFEASPGIPLISMTIDFSLGWIAPAIQYVRWWSTFLM